MNSASQRILNLSESQTIAMAQKSRELKAQGYDVINMSVGEPDFNTPDHIKEAAIEAIKNDYSHYTPVPGFKDLIEAISKKLKDQNNLSFSANQIVVSCGAKHSLANVFLSLLNKGDEVIIPAPYWVSYIEQVKLAEGKNVIVDTHIENEFKIRPDQLKSAITPQTKAILLCSPSNPTGNVYTKEELKKLAEVIAEHNDIYVISDEIYEHITYEGKHESIAALDEIKDRVIVINGVSKGYAMTGWRIGYMAGPEWIAKACAKLQGQMTSGASAVAQRAALAALTGPQNPTKEMNKAFLQRRDLIISLLEKIDGIQVNIPKGAFYVFPDVSEYFGKTGKNGGAINNSLDLCMYILNNAHVAVVPGSAFGSSNNIRISYATSEENIKEGITRIHKALDQIK